MSFENFFWAKKSVVFSVSCKTVENIKKEAIEASESRGCPITGIQLQEVEIGYL